MLLVKKNLKFGKSKILGGKMKDSSVTINKIVKVRADLVKEINKSNEDFDELSLFLVDATFD